MVGPKAKEKDSWFIDRDSTHRWIYHRVRKHVLSEKTRFQRVEIIDTFQFGRMVILDEKIQSAEADEYIYHETLVHPVMITHPRPKNILILGAGEGATLREVLKHPAVKKAVMIDIDEEFVSLCRRYLRKWHKGSYNDPRLELVHEDACAYLKQTGMRFDVIIADISDPAEAGPASQVYTKKFYTLVKMALRAGGIFTTHATAMHYLTRQNTAVRIFKTLAGIFPKVDLYSEYIPSYGALWAFTTGSFQYSPRKMNLSTVRKRLRERRLENLSFYDAEIHERLFRVPVHARRLLAAR